MASESKSNFYIFSFLIFLMVLNYLIVIGKYLFFDKNASNSVPINYEIFGSKNIEDNMREIESDSINLSNEMFEIFENYNFSIDSFLDSSYENIVVFSSLPEDFLDIESVKLKKDLFIKTILPIVFLENEKVLEERNKILQWWTETEGGEIDKDFWPEWLKSIVEKYSFDGENIGNLLMSVDIVPISLALSQAAIESGWGTSRYARDGNAIFGQYTYDEEVGLLPKERSDGKKYLIRKFSNISESTASYIKNLNTHSAYIKFREVRKKLRMNGERMDGGLLAEELINYSERKNLYIQDIKDMIKANHFERFDDIYTSKSLIN